MKRTFLLLFVIVGLPLSVLAGKPYNEWEREDIIQYFEDNNIVFEGEYRIHAKDQDILIGRLDNSRETVTFNFFLEEGKLAKALLTTSDTHTFFELKERVEEMGFERFAESNDQLGNQYMKYKSGRMLLNLVNQNADWPEVYFQP